MRLALLVAIALALAACGNSTKPTPTPDPLDAGRVIVTVEVGEGTFAAIVSDTFETRAQGLSGRAVLGREKAMWFDLGTQRPVRFWMKDMRFPIVLATVATVCWIMHRDWESKISWRV